MPVTCVRSGSRGVGHFQWNLDIVPKSGSVHSQYDGLTKCSVSAAWVCVGQL